MGIIEAIATLALITSVVSLTYTIVVDHRRPRIEVKAKISYVMSEKEERGIGGPYFAVLATNHGPGKVLAQGMALSRRSVIKRWYHKHVRKDQVRGWVHWIPPESPHQLPMWLEVGQAITLQFPADTSIVQNPEIFDCLYIYDSLGRRHWAQRKAFETARKELARIKT